MNLLVSNLQEYNFRKSAPDFALLRHSDYLFSKVEPHTFHSTIFVHLKISNLYSFTNKITCCD